MLRFLEAGTPLGTDLVLLRMSGQEELGRLPEFHLEFSSPKGDIKPAEILGKNISWAFELPSKEPRYFNGFVTRFGEAGSNASSAFAGAAADRIFYYHATIHTALWFLTRRSDCRIFQQKSAPEIIKEVFGAYPFAEISVAGLTCRKREFCVQYRETDYNFVHRLLEEEGLFYYHQYTNGTHKLVVKEAPESATVEVPFAAERRTAAAVQPDHITSWAVSREIQPGRYTVDDFNEIKPTRPLTSEFRAPDQPHDLSNYEIFDYPGEFREPDEGQHYARLRLQELHARYEQFSGAGNTRLVAPGKLLKIDHPLDRYKGCKYLITSVSYTASAGDLSSTSPASDFNCAITAIDSGTPYRPARVTPKPVIQGPQTAIVVGPKNQEIWTDEHGRVKVQFHWDRYSKTDENSSCWVRVSQPIAGGKWGFLGLPRIGHEVVVEFLEGDPDRPLVTGSLYNGELKPPYKLPDHKTRTGLKTHSADKGTPDNFNELRFEDKKGAEEIYIHAEKDKTIRTKEMRTEWVGKESHLIVKENVLEQLDADHHITLKHDRNEKLTEGTLSLEIAKGDLLGKVKNKVAYDAGMEIHLKAGTTMVLESGTTLSLKVGSNHVTIDQTGVTVEGAMVNVKGKSMIQIDAPMTMINSGAGGSPAGTGSGASPKAPKPPKEAGKSEGGEMKPAPTKTPPTQYSPQAQMFAMAAQSGTPFCEICNC